MKIFRYTPFLFALALPFSIAAQEPARQAPAKVPAPETWADRVIRQEGYATPPPELASAVLAPRHLNVSLTNLSPDKAWFVDAIGDGPVEMARFSKPFHELGGVFIDYKANRARSLTTRSDVGIQLISAADGSKKSIQIPAGARVSNATWAPDGKSIAFFAHTDDATHIYVADVASGKSRQLTKTPVLATLVTDFEFTEDGRHIAAVLVPDSRAAMPRTPPAPTGPSVLLADEADKNRLRTYRSLMSTPHDFALLEWHATGQLALIDAASGAVKKVGAPAMIRGISPSPDGAFVRVTTMRKPFSYIVPVGNFGQIEEIWDAGGKVLAKISERPINLGVQGGGDDDDPPGGRGGGAASGKREVTWRPDGQGLSYLEQERAPARGGRAGGDTPAPDDDAAQQPAGRGGAARPDRLYQWVAPFGAADAKVIYQQNTRMAGVRYSPDMKWLFFQERQGTGESARTSDIAVNLANTSEKFTLARTRGNDIYTNPGSLVGVRGGGGGGGRGGGGGGGPVLVTPDGASVFYQGTVYDKKPDEVWPKTFVDKVAIRTAEKTRIFESDNNGVYERVTSIVDPAAGTFIIARESPTEIAQFYRLENGRRTQLTHNEDPTPDLTRSKIERFTVSRPDGMSFRVTVNLPHDYVKGTRLPALFWFYPREYATQEAYDRGFQTFNKNSAPNFGLRSMEYFVRLGYAVVEPDAPIFGPQGAMNNNYVHDLRTNLSVIIDELDRRALVDRTRLALGGHSYGAFSTVNAMVHTPFFKAGIAGDGAYNRTLTPLGFQSERRDLWEAPQVYLGMSPFLYANNLTGALLMYHGLHDQNVGTDVTNSIRLFHALNGLGKKTALYLYPLEDHGPASKETLLDLWARWAAWLDKYVKNAGPNAARDTTDQGQR
ncbi:MAG TPA: prolyl oligopeptidase family serine peptidase [Vicinamibacterales bacterium]